jgi:uncharacterized protein (DUF433 family)
MSTGDACGSRPSEGRRQANASLALQWNLRSLVERTFDRITQNPSVLAGRATIRGLRISVAHVVNLVANGMTPAQIVVELPDLEEEDVRQALAYAAVLAQDEVHPIRA